MPKQKRATGKKSRSSKRVSVRTKVTDWPKALQDLINQFKGRRHPLEYRNRYELLVAVVLSAQDSDRHINKVAPVFFEKFPNISSLASRNPEDLHDDLRSVRNFRNKSRWLTAIAAQLRRDEAIPTTMEELTRLPGIGRKSASVIIRESGGPAEGIIVDLHVVRVAPRLGLTLETKPDKIEKDLMSTVPKDLWGEVGMAISFLGREVCRPSKPKCGECVMSTVCVFYNQGDPSRARIAGTGHRKKS